MRVTLRFDGGTLVLDGPDREQVEAWQLPALQYDARVRRWRAPAGAYRDIFASLHRLAGAGRAEVDDQARGYAPLGFALRTERRPREYQRAAVDAWRAAGRRGQIVLPTGAGKSFVAQLAIRDADRSALVVVPTLDLMAQWYEGLLAAFDVDEIGLLGGGSHELRPITVSTYDSFHLHAPRYGNRFGLLIFDESHHLAGPVYLRACDTMIAPFRLGLTATPERPDGRHELLGPAVGPIVYRMEITDLAGEFLAPYEIIQLDVALTDAERATYDEARATYQGFAEQAGCRRGRDFWSDFVRASSRSPEGRRAMHAYQLQRRLSHTCQQKLALVEDLLAQHANDRVIIFTSNNEAVYDLSRLLLLPTITHQTPVKERKEVLERFNRGEYAAVVTSRVLNEGVDVQAANVAIVLSGSGTVREQVQRLGRVLRQAAGKQAVLYEVVTAGTFEERVSARRREHDAFR